MLSLSCRSGLRACLTRSCGVKKSDQRHFLPTAAFVRAESTTGSKILGIFGRKSRQQKLEEERLALEEEDRAVREEEELERQAKVEQREEQLRRLSNRSKLNASDRRILKGQFPYVGVILEESDKHREPKFKAEMLARFGRETGIDPSVAWPTKAQIEEDREYERVLYDGLSFRQLVQNAQESKQKELEEVARKEKEFSEKLVAMRKELKSWKVRIESKNKAAEKEREKKEKILAELKQEYGYAINPLDPQFAEKIAAKEKEYAKKAKEEKKKQRQDKKVVAEKKDQGEAQSQ